MPFGNDLLLVALITSSRSGPIWILYVVVAAMGSAVGSLIDDVLTRSAGEKGLRKFVSRKQIRQLKEKIEEHAGWVIFTTTLLPPPFPYTAVIMTAAALQYSRRKLLLLVLCGRLVRFTLVALLAVYFGKRLLVYARKSAALEYLLYALIVISIVATTITIIRWVKKGLRSCS